MKLKKTIILLTAAFTAVGSAKGQQQMTFAYASREAAAIGVGTLRTDTYDVAIDLTNPSLVGMSITSIDVPVMPSAHVSDLSAWISRELTLEQQGANKVNVPDVSYPLEMPTQGNGIQWITVTLDEPFLITDGGVYVGYSFKVNSLDNTNPTVRPIVAAEGAEAGSLWLHTTRTYKKWSDQSADMNAISMLQVSLSGSVMPDNSCRLGEIPFKYVAANAENTIDVMVYNTGAKPITSVSYTTTAQGTTRQEHQVLTSALPATFGYGEEVEFKLPTFTEPGKCDVTLTLNAINDEPISPVTVKGSVSVAAFVPKHLAVVEEYTGMWCGNCPRGYVAMEKMNELYPDFIGIAYHNQDVLAMESGDPGIVSSYPGATIDRKLLCDPYNADPTSSTFSLPSVWRKSCDEFTPASVEVHAVYNQETHSVDVTSTVNWAVVPEDYTTSNYRMEYVLIADGLTDPTWYQANYYSGTSGNMEYMEMFYNAAPYVFGLVYNDAAIMTSGFNGISESIPSISLGEPTKHSYTFDTTEAYTMYGERFKFDPSKLRVAAMVIKGEGAGVIVNAAKCDVNDNSLTPSITVSALPVSVTYYDLSGRQIDRPNGVCVRQTRYSDGSQLQEKIYK